MATVPVTARISVAAAEKIERLAEEMGMSSKNELFKSILEKIDGGEIDVIAVEPEPNAQLIKLEAKVELLSANNERLETKLLEANREGGLAGIETKQKAVKTLIQEEREDWDRQRKMEDMEKELLKLRQERNEHLGEIEDLSTRANYLGFAEKVLVHHPKAVSKVMGLLGIEDDGLALSGPDDEQALSIGRSILEKFSPEQQVQLQAVLLFFANKPQQLEILASKVMSS